MITLNAIYIENHFAPYYIASISGKKLLKLAKADIRRLYNKEDTLGIQRKIERIRVNQITKYIDSSYSVFPNSIILNLKSHHIIKREINSLQINDKSDVFDIIDGQHRVEAFRESKKDFNVLVSIFIDLPNFKMAEIFKTINSNQKPLDPSLREELEAESPLNTPEKFAVRLAKDFTYSSDSPLYKHIKLYGVVESENSDESDTDGQAIINSDLSLAAFVNEIIDLIYYKKGNVHLVKSVLYDNLIIGNSHENVISSIENQMRINESKYVFWKYYRKDNYDSIKKILHNYFLAIKNVLPKDFYASNSYVFKTIGFRAIMKLFVDVYNIGYSKKDLSYNSFLGILNPLTKMDGTINTKTYQGTSYALASIIYKDMYNAVFK